MFTQSATHRGAPFVGRRREIGILTHLIDEGLRGSLGLIQIAGETGSGRRRLLAEALREGPDAEWVHLAPGGVVTNPHQWIDRELTDLLDTYPEARFPSWALHALGSTRRHALRRQARVPMRSTDPIRFGDRSSVQGAAIGAVLEALTGQSLVIVDAGLWPPSGDPLEQMLWELMNHAKPGVVILAAVGPDEVIGPDLPDVRTLALGPLESIEVRDLVDASIEAEDPEELAAWLHHISSGHPFFIQELIRWLEEMGHVRVDDDHGQISFLNPVSRLPVPFNLRSIMNARYQRLTPEAVRLLHLISVFDGKYEFEALRRIDDNEDTETFEEAMALLRRRGFLLYRTKRRPVALASSLWNPVIEEGVREYARHSHPGAVIKARRYNEPRSPLARAGRRIHRLDDEEDPGARRAELARLWKLARKRPGLAWDTVRGRVAVKAARLRWLEDRNTTALRWTELGIAGLSKDHHPGLRRSLLRFRCAALEKLGRSIEADHWRAVALDEALDAGHLRAAAEIRGVIAEGRRRLGLLTEAIELAGRAEDELREMGLPFRGDMAAFTRTAALIDARRLEEASRELEVWNADEETPLWGELLRRIELLERTPPLPVLDASHVKSPPAGWEWGLEASELWQEARRALRGSMTLRRVDGPRTLAATLRKLHTPLLEGGHLTALADLTELRLRIRPEGDDPGTRDRDLREVLSWVDRLHVPERKHFLAETLHDSPFEETATYKEQLLPVLMQMVPPRVPAPEPVRVYLTGRPRVDGFGSTWPLCLWPEWWLEIMTEVFTGELLGDPVSGEQFMRLIDAAHEPPEGGVDSVLREFNELLRGTQRIDGGLIKSRGDVRVDWSNLWCDVREFLTLTGEAARRQPGTRNLDAALALIEGNILPGQDGNAVHRLRAHLTQEVDRAMDERLRRNPVVDAETMVVWREGPGRLVDRIP